MSYRKRLLFVIVLSFLLFFLILRVKAEPTGWSQTYGGTGFEYGRTVIQTSDGGYAITGETTSFGAGSPDVWLVKTDANGGAEWNQTYGGTNGDIGYTVIEDSDGGYAVVGSTASYGAGLSDVWLVKTDVNGGAEWNQTYGGTDNDGGFSLVETDDGGYAMAGSTESFGAGGDDVWLVKTDAGGNMQWNQTYGGTESDVGLSVVETIDGGFAIAGITYSFGAGESDVFLIKTDASGNMQWNQTYGGTESDCGWSVLETVDGGYAIAGFTDPNSADYADFWLIKTDSAGNAQWNQTYAGADRDIAFSVVETVDGGYAVAGHTTSFGDGSWNFWLVKTDVNGGAEWNQTYGGTSTYSGGYVVETSDGGYAIAGYTFVGGLNPDFLLVKTDEYGVVPEAAWVVLPLLLVATLSIFVSKRKLLHKQY